MANGPQTLKKIKVRDVRLGMFVHELCGSWMDHPFWKTRFRLADPDDLKSLKSCGIAEIWIDTAKGLDVETSTPSVSHEAGDRGVDAALRQVAKEGRAHAPMRCTLTEELDRARVIHAQAKQAVVSMFQEVRMGQALHIDGVVDVVDDIAQSVSRNPSAFLSLAKLKNKDDYTYLHSVAVCAFMMALGKQLGLEGETLRSAGLAGLLHDVGKMAIPDEVLNKPGRLTDAEFDLMKTHPRRGWEILGEAAQANDVALDVCLHHHERVDGTGYPDRQSGDALSLFARMGAVCDVYDALTSDRCYKKGWTPVETIRKMTEWRNGHFDQRVFHAFVKVVGIFPAGTLVRLKSGRLGIVTDQSEDNLLAPVVKVFFSANANAHIMPEFVDLSKSRDAIASCEDAANWGFDTKVIGAIA
ncbi:MAG: HD-GYP domain-containing protein [Betaproteobacteria bacterium]|nr:HD-GYP domain-containing protein [Betaproteobacteria bacterium]